VQKGAEVIWGGVRRNGHDVFFHDGFPLTARRADSLKRTAERISCQWTLSGSFRFFLFTPQFFPRWRAFQPSAMTVSVSCGEAAPAHGPFGGTAAAPRRMTVERTAPSLTANHAAASAAREAFS